MNSSGEEDDGRIEGVKYDKYGREIEFVPPGGHCYKRFKREMDVFEKQLDEWRAQIAVKWKQIEKKVMKMDWKSPFLDKQDGFYEGEVKDGVPHGVGVFTTHDPDFCRGDTYQGTWINGVMQGFAYHQMGKTENYFFVFDGKAHGKSIMYLGDSE